MTNFQFLQNGPDNATGTVLLAHGAGAPMDSPFLTTIAKQLGEKKKRILRFEFPYMQMRRVDGRRRPPNPTKILIEIATDVVINDVVDYIIDGQKDHHGELYLRLVIRNLIFI